MDEFVILFYLCNIYIYIYNLFYQDNCTHQELVISLVYDDILLFEMKELLFNNQTTRLLLPFLFCLKNGDFIVPRAMM